MDETKIIRLTKKQLLRQNIDHGMNIFMIYVVTLSIFPGFLYENTGEHRLGDWYVTLTSIQFIFFITIHIYWLRKKKHFVCFM